MDDTARIFGPEHEAFRETLRRFLDRELVPNMEAWEKAHIVDRGFWRKAGELGLLSPGVPEMYGGPGGDFLHQVIVSEELGRSPAGASAGVSLESGLPAMHILAFGTEEQKRRWLPPICAGEVILTVGMTEPHCGSDLQAIRTTAVRDGDDYVINGSKIYISGGINADLCLLACKTDPGAGAKGISLFLVEADRPGYKRGRNLEKMGMKAGDTAELFFENLRVPAASMLGPEGGGFAVLMKELPRERLTIAARSLTAAELAFDLTLAFVKERTAFGQRIYDFQNSQFVLADMQTELGVGRAFYEDCLARMLSEGLDNTRSAMAKLWLTELEGRITDRCVQLHGGAGYMSEYPISKLYTAARVRRIFGGTSEIMKYSIARQL
ncbi:MAG TPA: acyl-CoA dehydrogenase family protein [Steroidobacteraceae bacterium]|nr:acyl-CoA dehydrogenase family protein [Steroidobacteraceae bacterium]